MVTRLKNLIDFERQPERRQAILLTALFFLESVLVTLTVIYFRYFRDYSSWRWTAYAKPYQIRFVVLLPVVVLLGVYFARCLSEFMKKHPLKAYRKPLRVDRIKTEILGLVMLWTGLIWADVLFGFDLGLGNYVFVEGISVSSQSKDALLGLWDIVSFAVALLLVLVIFYGSAAILLRQRALGILPETSLIWTASRRYLERTTLEKRLQNRRRGSIWLAVFFTVDGCVASMWAMDYIGEAGAAAGLCVIALFVLFLKVGFFGRLPQEAGRLAEQIRCMSEGEELPEKYTLSENAILHEPSVQLKNIDSAMHDSVEKQVQAERLKIDLITNVSHDLKTPLTSMIGYTDLLKKEDLGAEARDYVEIISTKQEQLKNMIQDLFDLSKATSGADQMTIEILDMRRLLEQTLGDMEDVIRASGREIRTSFTEEALLFAGDNNKVYRVVQNLLENALKYSLQGTRIYIETARVDGQVEMRMKNIASYEMDFSPEEITERFVRGDKARTTEGHGLGLAISSSFVHNMGGTLDIVTDGDLFKATVRFPGVPG